MAPSSKVLKNSGEWHALVRYWEKVERETIDEVLMAVQAGDLCKASYWVGVVDTLRGNKGAPEEALGIEED